MIFTELLGAKKSATAIRHYLDERRRGLEEVAKTSRDPVATKVKAVVPSLGASSAGQFEESPVDLTQITNAYFSDSYISRAVDKISGLMFKSGWNLVSLNTQALEYVQTRLRLIEESTDLTTEQLLRELGANYVLYANAPIIKTRGSENLGGLQAAGYYGGEPINGLWPAAPAQFEIKRDEFNNIEGYQVLSEGGSAVEFSTEDVSHLTYHKPSGRAYGVPYIQNVLDDVLILRQIEENIARLIYRNLFPLQTYTVGLAEAGFESTNEEIEAITEVVQNMPLDGMLVLPERHKIDTVSSSSGMMDAYNYLKYFRQRIFTGLGVSESTMGIGDSTNKSTSDNQSGDLMDLVKDFQQHFATEIQQQLINEILFEGGFDPTLNPDDRVNFQFIEIEQSAKIARENHALQKYTNNVISLTEVRQEIGLQPATDLSEFYYQLISAQQTIQAEAAAQSAANAVANKDMPTNQSGTQNAPSETAADTATLLQEGTKDIENKNLLTGYTQKVNFVSDKQEEALFKEKTRQKWGFLKEEMLRSCGEATDCATTTAAFTELSRKVLYPVFLETATSSKEAEQMLRQVQSEAGFLLRTVESAQASLDSVLSVYRHCLDNLVEKEFMKKGVRN